jgi:hypothetical protein
MVVDEPPSDYELVRSIYNSYYEDFVCFDETKRRARNYVPLDVRRIAALFDCNAYVVFALLYDGLQGRYGVQPDEDGVYKPLFMVGWTKEQQANMPEQFRSEKHLLNFAMLASIYSTLREQKREMHWRTGLSIAAIVISIVSLLVTATGHKP